MALAVENTQSASGVAVASVTITGHVITDANLDIVTICIGESVGVVTVSSVVRNSQSYSLVIGIDDANFERVEIWKRDNPSVGTLDCVVTMSSGTNQLAAGATGIKGANLTLGTPSTNTGTSTNPSVTVVDSASGDLVISVLANDNSFGAGSQTPSSGTQLWEVEDINADSDFSAQWQTASGASTVCSWTNANSGSGWAAAGVAVKAAGGGGDTVTWVGYIG